MTHCATSSDLIFKAIDDELTRQHYQLELIASENIVSLDVMRAQGSVLTNKYAEGYPGRRYYNGCEHMDTVERAAIDRLKQLFNCGFANVQPHSGAQANQAVFLALLKPGDTFMGLDLSCGGHLTHGSSVNMSGKWFNAVSYGVDPQTHRMDYDQIRDLAHTHRPHMIIAGGSAYPRTIDFKVMREIADEVDAYLMVDMAHFAGLVAGGAYPSPLPYAHVVTSTTHKTLRGPRGGIIVSNDESLFKKINSAVFPGLQGGPLMHVIAAKAIAFGEALRPEFKDYAQNVIRNAKIMGDVLQKAGIPLVSGGTDSHLVLADVSALNISGHDAAHALEQAHITCNKNGIPFDTTGPMVTSGIRLGSAACTTRGFGTDEFTQTAQMIADILHALSAGDTDALNTVVRTTHKHVIALCDRFPIYEALRNA